MEIKSVYLDSIACFKIGKPVNDTPIDKFTLEERFFGTEPVQLYMGWDKDGKLLVQVPVGANPVVTYYQP